MEAILNALQTADGWILLFIQNHLRFDELTPWVIRFTKLGNFGLIWIVISLLLLIPKKTRRAGVLSIVALVASLCITNFLLKNYVARVRPYEVVSGLTSLLGPVSEYSFPSGHASAGFAAATVINKNCRKWLGWPCVILACLLSLSRLYVGVHYPTDVICGAIIGILIGLIVFWLFGEKKYKKRARRARRRRRR
ncbi:MAG: phosphatase PAP2 family protein [Lachnospiraceae bacterium]|nr:phosphatase PAP2 family protein [Lachnospiraceae bacterium]